ncbi:MAG TPA: DUF4123 domain-containing protein [Sphingopyxis sp.]|mgnify:CR=1 FL=1|nr:DUF4123 domain-containing protein [Sphingopyxis sp.]HMP44760.1 DUF4123 domain-containing protein [Sphingopyxis sp.]HMQ20645.1 DUF4123 domain-containing protein [Sphingopyxis sp.]
MSWFAVVDGARDPRLVGLVAQTAEHACLYSGDYDEQTRAALPWLVRVDVDEPFAETWRNHESGRFWGIICHSDRSLADLRRQLRKVTTARLPGGRIVLFRFWDPRVFSTFIEHATPEEAGPFFRAADSFIVDLGQGDRRRYEWSGGLRRNGMAIAAPAGGSAVPA